MYNKAKAICGKEVRHMEHLAIREIHLMLKSERAMLSDFLAANSLRLEEDVEIAFGLFQEDVLLGCGCAAGNLLKCFAIREELRGRNGLGMLVSRLTMDRFSQGISDLFVFTRPHNRELFARCGFFPVVETADVLLLENSRDGLDRFLHGLPHPAEGQTDVGAIVMNCNPLTNGHLALIRHAAAHCGFLYVFVVEEDRSVFPFEDRIALVRQGTADMDNVRVCPSGKYMISGLTFPTYFLKETEDPSALQSELDVTLFASRIAPALGIRRRFAGQEPFDAVTRQYNETMRRLLPAYGMEFCELPRSCQEGTPISASRVRRLLEENGGVTQELLRLVPDCTGAYLTQRFGTAEEKRP